MNLALREPPRDTDAALPLDVPLPLRLPLPTPSPPPRVPLPPLTSAWRRIWKRPQLMHYNRIIAGVLAANLAYFLFGLSSIRDHAAINKAVLVNLCVALLVRQHYVVNALFRVVTAAPVRWPLRLRWTLGKIYHVGGFHVGGAVAGTAWYALATVMLVQAWLAGEPMGTAAIAGIAVARLAIYVGICTLALPPLRYRWHNAFEYTMRFGGWGSLLLLAGHTALLVAAARPPGVGLAAALARDWQTWVVALLFFNAALPWLRLKRVKVEYVKPSSHCAIAHFDYGVTPLVGSTTQVARHPLGQWHSFATVPTPGRSGYRLAISRAGDWTSRFIDDLPSHLWVKSIPVPAVGRIATLFRRVVFVATGSGIGPCLSYLLAQKVPCRLVWSTRDPRKTYGDALVDEILAVQRDPIIWDTDAQGKPDMVQLAYRAYREFQAEAVCVVANRKLTWQVVVALESRGIPAYGAIWDS